MAVLESEVQSYSRKNLPFFDKERHILLNDAYNLIDSQEDSSLPVERLKEAIHSRQIHLYNFKGKEYVDRLDIGKVYHVVKESEGVNIERYFSTEGENPIDSAGPLKERNVEIMDYKTKKPIFQMDAYFPDSWDDNSAQIVAQKYFFNPNIDGWKEKVKNKLGVNHENSIAHLVTRVTNFFADKGEELGYFATPEDKEAFKDDLLWLQINRMGAFNSPVQFNAGIYNEYEIEGNNGINYIKDPNTGEVTKTKDGEYIDPQCHACFITGPRDDLESIALHAVNEIGIFSAGSGVGQDIGTLRANGEPLSGGGVASGPMSYLAFYDNVAGSIKSGGKSRRAARMTTMRQSHPDIMEFIKRKVREDHKALTLMKAGYEPGMDGEAATTVSFQNTNFSIRLDDHFFEQLKIGGDISLQYIKTGEEAGKINTDQMMKEISFGAWRIGDPGLQYESKIDEMHTCKNSGRQNSTNPCGEYMFLNDTSCNLASLNLLAFSDEKGNFDEKGFTKAVRIFSIAQDIANDVASYPVEDISEISSEFRTIGIGFAGLGSLLMRRGIPYDSDEGRALAGGLTALLTGASYETSIELAEKLGTFKHYEFNKLPMNEVMKKHQKSLDDVNWDLIPESTIKEAAEKSWDKVVSLGEVYGFRNAQASVIAPTGTISYLMGVPDSTGMEPSYSLVINKNLAGGGNLTIVNSEVSNALNNLGYDENQINDITNHITEEINGRPRNNVIGAPHLNPDHYEIFSTAVGDNKGNGEIKFEGHVGMMSAIQPFVSGGISKTNNLPESASVKDVYDGFVLGHELGLKGITVFRSNSKPTSAMNLGERGYVELRRGEKEDLVNQRNAYETEVKINNTPLHIIVSEYADGRPGQITFLSYRSGSTFGALLTTSGVQASRALKRGVSLADVADGWLDQEFTPNGLVQGHQYIKTANSPLDFAARLLKLEYLGEIDIANDPEKVDIEKLRGAQNGAFETYHKLSINDWDIDEVLNDPELGGFKEKEKKKKRNSKSNGKNNQRGVPCIECGNQMIQTSPNCYECGNCANKIGGCGL